MILDVSRSGYYAKLRRQKSNRQQENAGLLEEIRQSHKQSRKLYGVLRITKDLNHKGILCGKNRVYRLMKVNGISSCRPRKYKATTDSKHNYPVAENFCEPGFFYEQAKRGLDRRYHIYFDK